MTPRLIEEMQAHEFLPPQARAQLQRLVAKNLIESVGRASEDLADELSESPSLSDGYRITSIGAYHLLGWLPTFGYLDAMSFDTPIFSGNSWDSMSRVANSFDIRMRLGRTHTFLTYLSEQWHASGLNAAYLDWTAIERASIGSLANVQAALDRRARFSGDIQTHPAKSSQRHNR
jgi:hypothetical protein